MFFDWQHLLDLFIFTIRLIATFILTVKYLHSDSPVRQSQDGRCIRTEVSKPLAWDLAFQLPSRDPVPGHIVGGESFPFPLSPT